MLHRALALILLGCLTLAAAAAPAPPPSSQRSFLGLWVTRWDYRTQKDVADCIDRAAALGATDVFWQARGQCDAFYRSDLEPWGRELFRDLPRDATDPGFDPLAAAVTAAHAHGLRLHAWVNVMPLWKGTQPPTDPRHPFNAHPEWRLRDSSGSPQALNEHYVIVNPLLPAVHDHIVAVCRDIVTRYAVDGLHMDYVRFVSDTMKDPAAFPGDPESVSLFKQATGRAGLDTPEDKEAFRDFKRDRITELVRRIRREAVESRPGVVLTAAVWRRPDLARDVYLQDAAAWLNSGVLDRACPMIYSKDDQRFRDDLSAWIAAVPAVSKAGRAISPGVGVYMHAPGASAPQIEYAAAKHTDGVAIFAYAALYESVDPNQDKSAGQAAERAARLKAIRVALAPPPTPVEPSPRGSP